MDKLSKILNNIIVDFEDIYIVIPVKNNFILKRFGDSNIEFMLDEQNLITKLIRYKNKNFSILEKVKKIKPEYFF